MAYTNSSLVAYTKLSPNHSGQRTHGIDRISPHCVVGQCTAEGLGDWFSQESTQASSNYGIDKNGRVGMYVEEKNRSWCTSSNANDQRAITIECASGTSEPYEMNDKVYATLITLCTDICKRNGKKKLLWFADKDKSLNYAPASDEMLITVHRWFANKSCPGNWLYARLSDVAAKVTANLGGTSTETPAASTATEKVTSFPAVPFTVKVIIDDLNYRTEPSMSGVVKGQTGKGVFTITEVSNGWGRLKSGAGWIYLENPSYCTVKGSTGQSTSQTTAPAQTVTTTSDEETIWNTLFAFIGNAYGTAGLMGNLYAECGLKSNNLQNNGNTKLGMTDAEFTAAFDNGFYAADTFIHDGYGYGLAQWTYYSRKQALLNYAKAAGKSIGDLAMQLGFLCEELKGYTSVLNTLKNATSVREASDVVLTKYERPADQSEAVQVKRAGYGQTYYDKYAGKNTTAHTTEQKTEQATTTAPFTPYLVRVSITDLNIRKGPGTNYAKTGKYTGKGVFTIVDEADGQGATRWGLLKAYSSERNGWISLDYTSRV